MTTGKIKAVLFIIVFLLIVAVAASWFVSRDETGAPAPVLNSKINERLFID